eukprot:UN12671
MVSIHLQYVADIDADNITITVYRGYKRGRVGGNIYDSFQLSAPSNTITVFAESGGYEYFGRKTGVLIQDSLGYVICVGVIKSCAISECGDYLIVHSWTAVDGALCDAVYSSSDNAVSNNDKSMSNPLEIFGDLDANIKYPLIGVLFTFLLLMCIICLLCFAKYCNDKKKLRRV